jgi:hypothetical protein
MMKTIANFFKSALPTNLGNSQVSLIVYPTFQFHFDLIAICYDSSSSDYHSGRAPPAASHI